MSRKLALIYSREERKAIENRDLQAYLGSVARSWELDFWWDQELREPEFEPEIEEILRTARVIVLWLSPTFLGSEFVKRVELPIVQLRHLSRQKDKKDDVRVVPVLYKDVFFDEDNEWIDKIHRPFPTAILKKGYKSSLYYKLGKFIHRQLEEDAVRLTPKARTTGDSEEEGNRLRKVLESELTSDDFNRLLEEAVKKAKRLVPDRKIRGLVVRKARKILARHAKDGKSRVMLSKKELEGLDEDFILEEEGPRGDKDAKYARWVLRAHRLHPQAVPGTEWQPRL